MKIKLAILEKDLDYLYKVVTVFNSKFAKELEIYSFTDIDNALNCLDEKKIDVLLASSSFKIDFNKVPKKCGFAYLVESLDIDRIDDKKTVCKFQKAELIYKQVLSIYSEQVPNITGIKISENDSMKSIAFASPCGGVGTSTCAAACAIALASKGFRTLYICGEIYGNADRFFSCDGQFNFGDVIYAIKSNKTNRTMKLQSTVKQDVSGVHYYSSVKVALDMMEMHTNDYIVLQNEFKALGTYDYVVFDMDFPRSQEEFRFFESCNNVVFVSDGTESSDLKIDSSIRAIQIIDEQAEFAIQPRLWLLRNKQSANILSQSDINVLGSFPMYQVVSPSQMAKQLALTNIFDQLF